MGLYKGPRTQRILEKKLGPKAPLIRSQAADFTWLYASDKVGEHAYVKTDREQTRSCRPL